MAESEVTVPLTNVIKFVRQLSHDLRNYLNAAELQAALISEITDDGEVKGELKRLREMVGELGTVLQKLTSALGDVKLTSMDYSARDFMEDLRQKISAVFPDAAEAFEWRFSASEDTTLGIDPQYLQQALLELFDNAIRHRVGNAKIVVSATAENGSFCLKLTEPKTDACEPSSWGREPLRTVSHGHYGLGLHRARRILAAHHGSLETEYDRGGKCLVSAVRLPLGDAKAR